MPIVNETDLEFAKASEHHLDAILSLLGIQGESNLRSAAEELAEIMDEPANSEAVQRAISFLQNALAFRDMLRQVVAKADADEGDDPEAVAIRRERISAAAEAEVEAQRARGVTKVAAQVDVADMNRRIDEVARIQKENMLRQSAGAAAHTADTVEAQMARIAKDVGEEDAEFEVFPGTIRGLISSAVMKEVQRERAVKAKWGDNYVLHWRPHPGFEELYEVHKRFSSSGVTGEQSNARYNHFLAKSDDVYALAALILRNWTNS